MLGGAGASMHNSVWEARTTATVHDVERGSGREV
jgi:hypothetical protein